MGFLLRKVAFYGKVSIEEALIREMSVSVRGTKGVGKTLFCFGLWKTLFSKGVVDYLVSNLKTDDNCLLHKTHEKVFFLLDEAGAQPELRKSIAEVKLQGLRKKKCLATFPTATFIHTNISKIEIYGLGSGFLAGLPVLIYQLVKRSDRAGTKPKVSLVFFASPHLLFGSYDTNYWPSEAENKAIWELIGHL